MSHSPLRVGVALWVPVWPTLLKWLQGVRSSCLFLLLCPLFLLPVLDGLFWPAAEVVCGLAPCVACGWSALAPVAPVLSAVSLSHPLPACSSLWWQVNG